MLTWKLLRLSFSFSLSQHCVAIAEEFLPWFYIPVTVLKLTFPGVGIPLLSKALQQLCGPATCHS